MFKRWLIMCDNWKWTGGMFGWGGVLVSVVWHCKTCGMLFIFQLDTAYLFVEWLACSSLFCFPAESWPFFSTCSSNTSVDGPGSRRKLYSAVPGRHFVVVRSYQPQAEGEIPLYKNDRVKGIITNIQSYSAHKARKSVEQHCHNVTNIFYQRDYLVSV